MPDFIRYLGDIREVTDGADITVKFFRDKQPGFLMTDLINDQPYSVSLLDDGGFFRPVQPADLTAPILTNVRLESNALVIDWLVESNEAGGTIYAGLRLASNPVQSIATLIAGSGAGLLAASRDETPTADDLNGGTMTAPANGIYVADFVHVDVAGNTSSVISSASITLTEAAQRVTVNSVTPEFIAVDTLRIDVVAPGAQAGDPVTYSIRPAAGGAAVVTNAGNPAAWPDSDFTIPDGVTRGSYTVTVTVADSDPFVSSAITLDTVAPVLTGAAAVLSGSDINATVNSNEARGTVYFGLRLSSSAVLTAATLIAGAGTGLVQAANIGGAATNAHSFANVAAGTYRVDMVQVDDFDNVSAVVSSGTVTIAAAGIARTFLPTPAFVDRAVGANNQINLTGINAGDILYFAVGRATGTAPPPATTLTLEGVAATLIGNSINGATGSWFFKIACPVAAAGNTAAALNFTHASPAGRYHVAGWRVTGTVATEALYPASTTGGGSPLNVSGDVGTGVVLAACALRGGLVTGATGLTQDEVVNYSLADWGYFSAATTPAISRTMQIAHNNAGDNKTALALALF